jgi:hypothetical protein
MMGHSLDQRPQYTGRYGWQRVNKTGYRRVDGAKRFQAKHALGLDPGVATVRVKKTRQQKS